MFQTQKELTGKKSYKKMVIGYDLGEHFSQISFCPLDGMEPETVSSVAGTEQYNIPTLLCKRKGVGQWYYGKEALKYAGEEGILVEELLTLALRGEDVMVEGEPFDPVALLTLFVRRSLSLLGLSLSVSQIEALMFTVEELSPRMVDVLTQVAAGLQFKNAKICFQSHRESFYYYTIRQNRELWSQDVMIFEYNSFLRIMRLECNLRTTPRVVIIKQKEYREMKRVVFDQEEAFRKQQEQELDQSFLKLAQDSLKDGQVSTVFLLGDGFKEEWPSASLHFLCRNRRVFQGNNLYSKGACYGMLERISPSPEGKSYVYLGQDKLKSNIGMKALRRGEDSYFAILDAGTNWYEASSDFNVILESGNTVDFIITPLTGGNVTEKRIVLEGLPARPRNTTRLSIHVEMAAVDKAAVTIEDLGFGELFPSSGKGWNQTISV